MPRAIEAGGADSRRTSAWRPFRIATKAKPIYHAGAVFASNYLVVVEAVAQRLLAACGTIGTLMRGRRSRPLVEGTIENLRPPRARAKRSRGPVVRGDTTTIVSSPAAAGRG